MRALGLAFLIVSLCVTALPAFGAVCETDAVSLIQQNDGAVGVYLKRVDGPIMAGFNESVIFEPASAIKVLVHAHALRQVQDGALTLATGIDWTRDLNEDVCGSHPCNVTMPQAENDPLSTLLSGMMVCSDNRHTHALRTFFGDAAILDTGDDLGLTDTAFNHIIGCPGCNTDNNITLVDLGRIYEGVADGYLDETGRTSFHDLMLNETNSGFMNFLNPIIDAEVAAAGMDPSVAADFKSQVTFAFKGGSYTIFGCNDPDTLYQSLGGIIELPVNNGLTSCQYVFGAWMNEVPAIVQSVFTVSAEVLRLAVCEALQTWNLATIDSAHNEFTPPNPWTQEGVLINYLTIAPGTDLTNVRLFADPLQDQDVPCETDHVKKIPAELIEFVPREIAFIPAGESVVVEVKTTIPIGQHIGFYQSSIHVVAEVGGLCTPVVAQDIEISLDILPLVDVDVDDNHGNVSDNILHITGAKGTVATGTFTIVNPNSEVKNVDLPDGPGNLRINPDTFEYTVLTKVGDPAVTIPKANITFSPPLVSLGAGEAQDVVVTIDIPDGLPVNAVYLGTVELSYEGCVLGGTDSDGFTLQLDLLQTQGGLDILQAEINEDFCPPDPWTQIGHVDLALTLLANGDHRNIRVLSGGLVHETLDTKLDEFNFFPQEIAYLAAGDTRTVNIILKVPIGQHEGIYSGYVHAVSENGGEDSVLVVLDICPIYDLDIKDNYANLVGNILEIQAIARSGASGGEWALRAFDVGIPKDPINNHDEFDGPGNADITCISCEFATWSPLWHEDDHDHHFHTNFQFFGTGSVLGETCTWEAGDFRRLMIGLFVPPIVEGDNHPGTYKGRLDCWALAEDDTVAHDSFDIEVQLARIVGPAGGKSDGTFGGTPTALGAHLYWGDFAGVGLTGPVRLYREDPGTDQFVALRGAPTVQNAEYDDPDVTPGSVYRYKLGIGQAGSEVFVGPLTIGGTPRQPALAQNAPNPFSDRTTIAFQLPERGPVSLKVYDLSGRLVRTLRDGEEEAGFYTVTWDRHDDTGRALASGLYFYRLTTADFIETKKMMILQ